ncbi:MAG TPA: hypothetical protein VFQ65_29545 [Kofleriaceae bacterium]|nr:hypothetical protein [Kofleriaceae bacterium]
MDTEATPDAPDLSTELMPGGELRGSVLDVVGALRAENDWDAVLEIVR